MTDNSPRGRKNDDGSVDVWVTGRRLHFPGNGQKPSIADKDHPPSEAGGVPRGVLIDVGEPVTMVSYDGWYARLTVGDVDVNRTQAAPRIGQVFSRRSDS